ncbi:MAG: hypothetical protein R3B96_03255 [Pirellulaceae bacterium]
MNDSPNEADGDTGAAPRSQSNPMIAIVIGVSVAVFGVFVAIGSYFFGRDARLAQAIDRPGRDRRFPRDVGHRLAIQAAMTWASRISREPPVTIGPPGTIGPPDSVG